MAASRDPDDRRTIPREQDAPRALIALMIVLMLTGVGGALLWIQAAGVAENVVGRPAPIARDLPVFTVDEVLTEAAKGNLLGRDVAIWRTTVREVTSDLLFWVGTDPDRLVPVALLGEQTGRQVERQAVIRAGDTVAIFGYIRAVRDANYLDRRMATRPEERARLARAQVYISALRVEHLDRGTD